VAQYLSDLQGKALEQRIREIVREELEALNGEGEKEESSRGGQARDGN